MTEIIGVCAKEGGRPFLDALKKFFNYTRRYEENVIKLQQGVDDLTNYWDDITERVKQGKQKGEVLNKVADDWLVKVEKLLKKEIRLTKVINEGYRKQKDQCCFGACNINPCFRYKCSKDAEAMSNLLLERIADVPIDAVTRPQSPEEVKSIIDEYKKYDLSSKNQLVDDVLHKLQDGNVKKIGIYGGEAVGKTRVVKEIINKLSMPLEYNRKRPVVIMVETGRVGDIKDIQDQIARQVGQPLGRFESIEQRARKLSNPLNFKEENVIICLDNIWEKFDLDKVGISEWSHCKFLMICRQKSVCEEMGVEEPHIFQVRRLCKEEARCLFWNKVSVKENMITGEYLSIADKLLSKCGGLPRAVTTLAGVLSGNTLLYWESFAAELEGRRPPSIGSSSSQLLLGGGGGRDDDNEFYSILETSYMILSAEERMMLLLCCLFPRGHAFVQELMRCAIGLGLIQRVDTLFEAEALANNWVDKLISSTLLEENTTDHHSSQRRHVRTPNIVRRYGISIIIAKDKHMLMVEAFHRWLWEETCTQHTAISLMHGNDHSRLMDLTYNKLEILILDRSEPRHYFANNFFEGLLNLKVLIMKGMRFKVGLPLSISKLKSLRTLQLEECKLGNITGIGELMKLVVLSLRESSIDELPEAIGNLCKLRLLDLNECTFDEEGIAANILSKLYQLEGLYAFNVVWTSKRSENSYDRIAELNCLRYLKVVEFLVEFNDRPIYDEFQFAENLDKFHICFGSIGYNAKKYSRILELYNMNNVRPIVQNNGLMVLLKKTQQLVVDNIGELHHIIVYIHQQEDGTTMQTSLYGISYCVRVPELPNLQHLRVRACSTMLSLSSTYFEAPNLTDLYVAACAKMKYIFMEHDQVNAQGDPHTIITFPALKWMYLCGLPELESVTGTIRCSATTSDDQQLGHHILFTDKIVFPLLEELDLYYCHKIVKLWEVNKEMSYYSSFSNLRGLSILSCDNLETLGSLFIATTLIQLKVLSIDRCQQLREVISNETNAPTLADEIFPSLKSVYLNNCPKLRMFISGANLKDPFLKLSSLQDLKIEQCPNMESFSVGPCFKTPKLDKVIVNSVEYSMHEVKDINSFLQDRPKPK